MSILRTCKDCQTCFWTTRRLQQCCEDCLTIRARKTKERVNPYTIPLNGPVKKTKRDCMRCKKGFTSEGIHDRMCTPCGTMGSSPYEN